MKDDKKISYAMFRALVGINILCHGLVRIPKIAPFREWMMGEFKDSLLPAWTVYAWGSVLPFLEFVIGFLILTGLFTRRALLAGGGVMMLLILGSCLAEKWEWAGLQMLYALCYFFLIREADHNAFALDGLRKK